MTKEVLLQLIIENRLGLQRLIIEAIRTIDVDGDDALWIQNEEYIDSLYYARLVCDRFIKMLDPDWEGHNCQTDEALAEYGMVLSWRKYLGKTMEKRRSK